MPNIALMRWSSWHKALGDDVILDPTPMSGVDRLIVSTLFTWRRQEVEGLIASFRTNTDVLVGGTGWDLSVRMPSEVDAMPNDYDLLWPQIVGGRGRGRVGGRLEMLPLPYGIGYSSRGCIRDCPFCPVPRAEGGIREVSSIGALLNPNAPNRLVLIDNNFFSGPEWKGKIDEIIRRSVEVDFNQGVDIRLIAAQPEQAQALGELRRRKLLNGDGFTTPNRLHFAWDRPATEQHASQVERAVNLLLEAGFKARDLTCFVLIGYPGYEAEEELFRLDRLHALNIQPYVMRWRDLDSTAYAFDEVRSNIRDWNNGFAWKSMPFADYRRELTHGRAAQAEQMVSLPI